MIPINISERRNSGNVDSRRVPFGSLKPSFDAEEWLARNRQDELPRLPLKPAQSIRVLVGPKVSNFGRLASPSTRAAVF